MMSSRPSLVVLAPITPAPSGNGLAMRGWSFVNAAAVHHDVHLVVIPVAGSIDIEVPIPAGVRTRHELAPRSGDAAADALAWMADPLWRARLARLQPLYPALHLVPPAMVAEVCACLGELRPRGVLALRLSLATLGLAVAERLGAALLIDADDDDVALHRSHGEAALADAAGRVAQLCYPRAQLVTAANGAEARTMTERYGLRELPAQVVSSPNGVVIPIQLPAREQSVASGRRRVLLVGNLTYGPNVDGARWLVQQVLPLLAPDFVLELAGNAGREVTELAGSRVQVDGFVAGLRDSYAAADVVVVPLLRGSGTRIKLLEALAYGRPVVCTPVGADGIGVVDGEHVLLADAPAAFAAAIERASEPQIARGLVVAGRRFVCRSFDADVLQAGLAALLARASGAR